MSPLPEALLNPGKRHDVLFAFEANDCNPNGDIDNLNAPRQDFDTGHGFTTDVFLKRRIRDYLIMKREFGADVDIYMDSSNVSVNDVIAELKKESGDLFAAAQERFWDVRAFGAVITDKAPRPIVGPWQISFSRSVLPIFPVRNAITKVMSDKATKDGNRDSSTIGAKYTIRHGLYVGHAFYSPAYARKTGFSSEDMALFYEALISCLSNTKTSSKDLDMAFVGAWLHDNPLGSANSRDLFEKASIAAVRPDELEYSLQDYAVSLDPAPTADVEYVEVLNRLS